MVGLGNKTDDVTSNKLLASLVRTVHHECHIPLDFRMIASEEFSTVSRTLSYDMRTLRLVELAAANMVNVTALSFSMGHHNIVQALLRSFLTRGREANHQIDTLSLVSSSLSFDQEEFYEDLDFSKLKSIKVEAQRFVSASGGGALLFSRYGQSIRYAKYDNGSRSLVVTDAAQDRGLLDHLYQRRSK